MKRLSLVFGLLAIAAIASAQTSPIRMNAHSYTSTGTTFQYLNTPCGAGGNPPQPPNCAPAIDGTEIFCEDCEPLLACIGGGHGAWAQRISGLWTCNLVCGAGPLPGATQDDILQFENGNWIGTQTPNNISVNGVINVQQFGRVSGSASGTTGSINAGSTTLIVANASGWQVGMGIAVAHGGAMAPTTTQATPIASPSTPTPIPTGAVTFVPTNTPTPVPTATSYVYKVAPYYGGLSWGPAVTAATITNLSQLNSTMYYNTVRIPGNAGPESYLIYRNNALVGNAINTQNRAYAGLGPNVVGLMVDFKDFGQTYANSVFPATPPASASAGTLSTHIVSCGGSTAAGTACTSATFTLANAATTAVSNGAVAHDDCNLATQAIATLGANGGDVYWPSGTYHCASTVQFGTVNSTTSTGLHMHGGGMINTQIVADDMLAGSAIFRLENTAFSTIEGFQLTGDGNNPTLVGIESNINQPTGGAGIGSDFYNDIFCTGVANSMGYCFAATAPSGWDQNNASHLIHNMQTNSSIMYSSVLFGHLNSLENKISDSSLDGGMCTVELRGGSFTMSDTELNADYDNGAYLFCFGEGTYTHDSIVTSISSETPSNFIYVDEQAVKPLTPYVHAALRITGADIEGTGTPGEAEIISHRSKSFDLVITNSRGGGNSRPHYTFNNVRLSDNTWGCGYILYDSQVISHENNWGCALMPHTGFAPVNAGNGGWVEYDDFGNSQTNKAFTIPGNDSYDNALVGFDIYGVTGNGAVPAASIRLLFNAEAAEFLTTGANLSYTNSGTVAPPTLGTCTGGVVDSTSTNVSGEITGATDTTCAVVFNPASPFTAGVRCQITDISGDARVFWPSSENNAGFTVSGLSGTGAEAFIYHCDGF